MLVIDIGVVDLERCFCLWLFFLELVVATLGEIACLGETLTS